MEGLEYQAHFLSENEPFEEFAAYSKQLAVAMLSGQPGLLDEGGQSIQ